MKLKFLKIMILAMIGTAVLNLDAKSKKPCIKDIKGHCIKLTTKKPQVVSNLQNDTDNSYYNTDNSIKNSNQNTDNNITNETNKA